MLRITKGTHTQFDRMQWNSGIHQTRDIIETLDSILIILSLHIFISAFCADPFLNPRNVFPLSPKNHLNNKEITSKRTIQLN